MILVQNVQKCVLLANTIVTIQWSYSQFTFVHFLLFNLMNVGSQNLILSVKEAICKTFFFFLVKQQRIITSRLRILILSEFEFRRANLLLRGGEFRGVLSSFLFLSLFYHSGSELLTLGVYFERLFGCRHWAHIKRELYALLSHDEGEKKALKLELQDGRQGGVSTGKNYYIL